MKIKQKYSVIIIIIVAIVLFFACYLFYKNNHKITLSTEQQQQVNQLLDNSATRCVDVYLIDLPVDFQVSRYGNLHYKNIDILTQPQYLPPFKQMIILREQELENTRPVNAIDGKFLKAIYPIPTDNPDKMQGVIFEHMESEGMPDVARILEAYRWQDEVTLKIEIKARNGLAQRYDKNRSTSPELYDNNVPDKLNELYKLFNRFTVRDDFTIPTEPGFCFTNGFMKGANREQKEMSFLYRYGNKEDFYFEIKSEDNSYNVALLDTPEFFLMPYAKTSHTIYKGTRSNNQLTFEELITKGNYFPEKYPMDIDNFGYIFTLGINMANPTSKKPKLIVQMFYKTPIDDRKSYTKEQLMVIWQRITDSIRIRESSFEN